ncbi:MAG: metal-dependent hydrolase [Bacteroidia bacterium]
MNITYYGHSCFGVEVGGKYLLFDPFITPNEKAKHIDIQEIPADYILLSHGHGDHIADAEAIAKRTGAKVISSYEITVWLNGLGISDTHPMNVGGKWKFDFGTVKCVVAAHSSGFPDGSYAGNPMGFVITTEEGTFYYSGDTALTYDMKLIAEQHTLDFAFLCIGDNFTMDAVDAATCAEFINCNDIIGMHFDTFGYITIEHEAAKQAFAQKGKTLQLMTIGEKTVR